MTLRELKASLIDGSVPSDFLIFLCPKNRFLALQYIDEMCRVKACDKVKIQSIYEPLTSALSILVNFEDNLNVLDVDTFDETSDNYSQFVNTVVICNKIDKKILSAVGEYVIEFPELQGWQLQDYVLKLCPNLPREDVERLCRLAGNDAYRVLNELDKVTIFPQKMQPDILVDILNDPNLDLCEETQIFPLVKAVISRDYPTAYRILAHIDGIKVDPIGFTTLVLRELKPLAIFGFTKDINLADAEGIFKNPKQAYYVSTNWPGVPPVRVIKQIEFLSAIDLRLKASELDMTPTRTLEYIVEHLLAC